ncbi:hypothetical protein AR1Y2_1925 [Anaerostipes rhamnosivorans]|uniref:Uncharacterized protein n=1 Tax=Anaerostipes rhamnosivorans TaxID=1229621 RepID=A0A4P8IJR4_9FIRM|nr:hypothetical protein AR1Y2_1925 [Anaerostipes rhamnosivorans]
MKWLAHFVLEKKYQLNFAFSIDIMEKELYYKHMNNCSYE